MSIEEDLRISNVDGENAPHEFLSDIREAAGYDEAKPAEIERVELAQAQSSEQTPKTDRVENVPPAPPSGSPNQVVPDQNNIAHLPADVSLDDIRIEGSNLVLVQADGTQIVIVNGALHVPAFMLGDVELPRDTVIAALNDSNINVAAGPDGGDTATPAAPSSGAEFQDTIQQDGGAPTELAQLLADTQQPDATPDNGPELFDDVPVVISGTQLLTLTETANGEGGFEEQTVNGQFGFDGGEDVGVITGIAFVGTTNIDEEGSTTGVPNGLTSGGKPVTVTVSSDGLTITGTVEGSDTPVFVLKVTNIETGAFTFTQSGPLDHPDLGQTGAADTLRLQFSYTVTDKDGDSATGIASIDINDDGPSIDLGDATDNRTVSEAGLLGSESPAITGSISLGVDWGADHGVNRDLTFDAQNAPGGLTSHGAAIHYEISGNGHTLTAYTGPESGEGRIDVFVVTLDPKAAHGTYSFQLLTSIDHPQGETQSQDTQIDLSFGVTASDADGDTVGTSFTVTINDDVPNGNDAANGAVINDDLQEVFPGNAGGEGDAGTVTNVSGGAGSLFTHGADGFKSIVLGEQMSFSAVYQGEDGFAHTESVQWGKPSISGTDTTFTATGGTSGQTVATLVVHADGSYEFTVSAPLVHSDSDTAEDDLSLAINYIVTDGDNDTAKGSLTVTINDDTPTASIVTAETVLDDEAQTAFLGNNGGAGDVADAKSVTGAAGALFTAGADGVASVSFTTPEGIKAIYNVDGHGVQEALSYTTTTGENGESILTATGVDTHAVVFTLTVGADGSYQFDLAAPLVHPTAGTSEENLPLTIGFMATDGDGDTATGSLAIGVNDDVPVANVVTAETVLDDEAQTAFLGNNGGAGDVADAKSVTGAAGALFTAGADGVASVSFTTPEGIKAIYNVDGHGVQEALSYTTTTGENGGSILTATGVDTHAVVFTLTVGADGSYQFDLAAPLVHPTAGTSEENLPLTIGFTATDGDGDTATGSLTIGVNDDVPVANVVTAETVLDDEAQTAFPGNNGGAGDVADAKSVTGAAGALFTAGADGVASVSFDAPEGLKAIYNVNGRGVQEALSYATTTNESGETVLTATGVNSHNTVFTLTVGADGSYKFDLSAPLVHTTAGASEENLPVTIGFTTTDADGDTATGSLTINVNDDVPVVSQTVIAVTADEGDISNLLLSQGNSPNDGTADGSSSEPSVFGLGDAATVSGSVASTVSFGADGAARVGGFSFAADATQTLSVLQLSSKGGELSYTVIGNVIIGYVNTGNSGYNPLFDRPVLSLMLKGDGSFTFQQYDQLDHAPGAGNDLQAGEGHIISGIDFGSVIKATDADGDSVTLGGKLVVTITDDLPTVSISLTGRTVTHDETAGQNAGSNDTGALSVFAGLESGESLQALGYARGGNAIVNYGSSAGADEPKSVSLTLDVTDANSGLKTISGEAITLTEENGLVIGRDAHGDAVFAISIDSSGRVSIAQYQAIQHPNGGDANDLVNLAGKVSAVVTATDFDGDVATKSVDIGGKIQFRDDAPVLSGPAVAVTSDEGDIFNFLSQGNSPFDGEQDGSSSEFNLLPTGLSATVTGSVASTVAFGADGAAQGGGFSVTANATQTLAALHLSSQGGELSYTVIGNMIIGYVNTGSPAYNPFADRPVLSLTLESDGSFQFQQYDQLDHASGAGNDLQSGSTTVSGIDFGSVIQAIDRDGDSITLGGKLIVTITDDAPVVSIFRDGSVTIDESGGHDNDNTRERSVRNLFAGVTHAGSDPDMRVVYARDDVVDTTVSVGADEPAAASLTLRIDNAASGLTTTAGAPITLTLENGIVVGRIPTGEAAFAIHVDSDGRVSVAQYLSLSNPNVNKADDDRIDLAGKVSAVITAIDSDGDIASQSVSIGNAIRFDDDGPVLDRPVTSGLSLSENDLPDGTSPHTPGLSATGYLDISLGADGGKVVLAASQATWSDATHSLTANDGSWKIVLNSNGTYTFSLLDNTLAHGPASNGANNLAISVTYTATDGDGDKITGTFGVGIKDDVPVAGNVDRYITLSEADINGSTPDTESKSFTVNYGADGAGATTFTGAVHLDLGPGMAGNVDFTLAGPGATYLSPLKADGQPVTFQLSTDGTKIIGYVGTIGNAVIELTANGTTVTAKLLQAVDHFAKADGSPIDMLRVDATVAFHDGDGDTTTSIIRVEVNDDMPTASYSGRITIQETANANGSFVETSATGTMVFDGGADGAKVTSIAYGLGSTDHPLIADADAVQFVAHALRSGGKDIEIEQPDGLTLLGKLADGTVIFKVEVTDPATGAYKFTQYGPIDQADANETGAADGGRMKIVFTVTDGDGDTATNSLQIDINDDGPKASYSGRITVQESANANGSFLETSATGTMVFDDGADGAKVTSIAYGLGSTDHPLIADADAALFTAHALQSGGKDIRIDQPDGLTLLGKLANGTVIFKVEVTDPATGAYKFTQYGPIDQADANETGAADGGRMKIVFTVTDGDGDTATNSLQIDINDGGPSVAAPAATGTLSETGLPSVSSVFGDLHVNVGADSKATHVAIGMDGNGNPIINSGLTSDGVALEYLVRTTNGVDQEIVAFKAGDTADNPVFIVSVLHPGSFAATLFQNLDHPEGSDNISLNLVARVFDGDGDYVDQPFTINVADSVPTLVANMTASGNVTEGGSTLETHSFASGTVNLAIPDVSTITSTITVPAGGTIHDVNVSINLTHTFMADLEITLIAPDGTRIRLVDDNGGAGDPNGTIMFDDEAANSFTSAPPPFVGTWRPAIDQLSLLDGKSMAGTWTLEIRDDLGADVGTLRDWSLQVEAGHDVSSANVDLSSLVSVGADDGNGAAVFALKTIATAESLGTVTAGGQQVKVVSDGTTLTGYAEGAPGTPLFTLTVSANGTATFVLYGEFDHAAGSDNLPLDLGAYVKALDSDHDAVTLGAGQFVINVADSLPTAANLTAAMSENDSKSVTLIEGTHFTFGADEIGAALSFGTPSYTGVPAGLILGTPSITLGADGHTITINPGTAFDRLPAGQTVVLHIPYTVTDGDHDSVTKDIAVTINGTNDAPAFGWGETAAPLTEHAGQVGSSEIRVKTGHLTFVDPDASDHHMVSIEQVSTNNPGGSYLGAFSAWLNHSPTDASNSGRIDWKLQAADSSLDFLAEGQTVTQVYKVIVTDASGALSSKLVTATVTGTNDAPIIAVDAGDSAFAALTETNAGLSTTGTLSVADVDVTDNVTASVTGVTAGGAGIEARFTPAQLLSFFSIGSGAVIDGAHTAGDIHWTFNSNSEAFNFLPNGWQSLIGYTVEVSDGHGGTDTHVVQIKLTGTNDAPVVSGAVTGTATENGASVTLDALANASDVDLGTTLSVDGLAVSGSPGALPAGVSYDAATHSFTLDPNHPAYQSLAAGTTTTVTVNYSVSDGITTTPASVSWKVTGTNDAPEAQAVTLAAIAEDSGVHLITTADLLAGATDVDHDTLTVSGLSASSGTLVDNGNGTWTFTPDADDDTAVSFSYTVSDGTASVAGSATLDLTPVNDAPVVPAVTLAAIAEDSGAHLITAADLLAGATDVEHDTLTVSGLSASSGMLVDNGNGTWTFTPDADDDTAVSFSYTVSDGTASVAGSATLDLTPVNDAPVVPAVTLAAIAEDSGARLITAADLLAGATDVEHDTLTVSGLSASSGMLVDNGNGTWTFTPDADDDTAVSFSYTVSDGTASVAGSATLDLTPVNDAPVAVSDVLTSVAEDSGARTISFASLTDNDSTGPANEAGQSLTVTAVSNAVGGTVAIVNGQVVFTPAANFNGTASFDYTISDNGNTNGSDDFKTSIGHASFTVTAVNEAPVANEDGPFATLANTALIVTTGLLANDSDPDGQTLTAVMDTGPQHGAISSFNAATGTFTYTPTAGFVGVDTFTYYATDGALQSNPVTVSIIVSGGSVTSQVINFGNAPDIGDFSTTAFNGDWTILMGNGKDKLTTSWDHDGGVTSYYGGDTVSDAGHNQDYVNIVFSAEQLQEILLSSTYRAELQDFLDGGIGSGDSANRTLDLSGSSWHAKVAMFGDASLSLAVVDDNGHTTSTVTYAAIGENLPDYVAGSAGNDTNNLIVGTTGDDTLSGGSSDSDIAGNGNDILAGGGGNDTLWGGDGSDLLLGGAGDDQLRGGSGNDILFGGVGDDILVGGSGLNTMTGGGGSDTFVIDAAAFKEVNLTDVITDFKNSQGDTLDVSNLLNSLLGHEATQAQALANVKGTVAAGSTTISVNDNGTWHDVAVLQNYTSTVKILYDDDHHSTTTPTA
ncbi:DUF5801 repeats-in-toxin domain-containing protein [Rhizobium sullae]|nr:DUF5801 repeats-in-toxin domain-containing protein [Rhizobium sullae]